MKESEAEQHPVEFLNSLELTGKPNHILKLKVGSPIMVLRSLETPKTTNGTCCVETRLHRNLIEATISCGPYKGEVVLLPRIPLIPSDTELPFQFRRLQFPIRPCFAMTVNKSQGQTFKAIGVDVSSPCFTHGMFYVAASRLGSSKKLCILAPNQCTRHVVYPEAYTKSSVSYLSTIIIYSLQYSIYCRGETALIQTHWNSISILIDLRS